MIEIRVTRPEKYSLIEPDLSAREGYYFTGSNQRDAIDKATKRFGHEVIDVEIKHGEYLGPFKRVEIGTDDEHFIQLPHTIPSALTASVGGSDTDAFRQGGEDRRW